MPKIFEYFGFVFFFYSNEHEPIHVHVVKNDEDAVFDIILENGVLKRIDRRKGSRAPLNNKDAQVAEAFVAKYYKNIVEKWIKFFVLKKTVRSTTDNKKDITIMNLQIISVKYVKPLSVEIHFSDGMVKTLDVGSFIRSHPHPQYNAYLNERKFKQFKIDMGNLVWGKNWDLIFPVADLHRGILSM